MHKHQSDSVTDASKQRLVDILSDSTKVLNEDASELLQTYLALPEGKLTTSKGKARALKWLESLAEKGDEKNSEKGANTQMRVVGTVLDLFDENVTVEMEDGTVVEMACSQHLVEVLKIDFEAYLNDDQLSAIKVVCEGNNVVKVLT